MSSRLPPHSGAAINAFKLHKKQAQCFFQGGERSEIELLNNGRRAALMLSLASAGLLVAATSASGKVKSQNPYNERRLLEQNKKIQEANNAPQDFPNFIREGFEVKVVTSDRYIKRDSGLIYLDIQVGEGDCPKDGQQVHPSIVLKE